MTERKSADPPVVHTERNFLANLIRKSWQTDMERAVMVRAAGLAGVMSRGTYAKTFVSALDALAQTGDPKAQEIVIVLGKRIRDITRGLEPTRYKKKFKEAKGKK